MEWEQAVAAAHHGEALVFLPRAVEDGEKAFGAEKTGGKRRRNMRGNSGKPLRLLQS